MKPTFLDTSKHSYFFKFIYWLLATLLLWLLVSFYSLAQNKVWDKTYGGKSTDWFSVTVATPDGGFLLGGSSGSDKSGDKSEDNKGVLDENKVPTFDYWLVKMDARGQKVWDKTYGGNARDQLSAIVPTDDGGFLLGGTSDSGKNGDKSQDNYGTLHPYGKPTDYWVIKIDAQGKKMWDKTFGGNRADNLTALVATSDGGFLLGGSSDSGKSYDKSEGNRGGDAEGIDYWVVKIDSKGLKLWDKTFGGGNHEMLSALAVAPDGSFLLGGTSFSGKELDKTEPSRGEEDFWVVKIDNSGKKVWDKTLGGEKWDLLTTVLATPDGGFLVSGSSGSGKNGDKSEESRDLPSDDYWNMDDYWVIKIDAKGKKVWDKTFGSAGIDKPVAIISIPEGAYLLGGSSDGGKAADKSEDKKGYWIIKLKEDGTKIWDRTFEDGAEFDPQLSALVATPDKGILLGGTSGSGIGGDKSEASRGGMDYWVVKVTNTPLQAQEIALANPLLIKTFGDAPFTLSALASSGLPVTFSLVSGPGTLAQNTLKLSGSGKIIVKVSQAGNDTYAAATDVLQTVLVEIPTPVTKLWDKRFGGDRHESLTAMVATPDGNYLLAGTSSSGINGDKSTNITGHWLVKINKQGIKLWDVALEVNGTYGTILSSVLVTPDKGYLLGGTSQYDVSGQYEIVKISSTGTKEWEKTFSSGESNDLNAMVATPDGGYLLGGRTIPSNAGYYDIWIIKIDSQGNKVWDKTLGGNGLDELTALVPTPDGGYLLGGNSDSDISGDKSEGIRGTRDRNGFTTPDFWVVKIDAQGNKLWDKTLGGTNYDNLIALLATPDGGYLLSGSSLSGKGGDKSEINRGTVGEFGDQTSDYWLVKIDARGKKLWDRTYGGTGYDNLKAVAATPDGGYVVSGSTTSGIGKDKSGVSRGGKYSGDYWVLKIAEDGNKVWDKTLGGESEEEQATMIATPDGSYLIGGNSLSGVSGDKSQPRRGNQGRDYWVVKIKEELPNQAQWDLRYGGSGTDNFTSAIKTPDGGYLSGGYSNSGASGDKNQSSQGKNDYWIVKSDQNGQKLWDKTFGGSADDYLNRVINTVDGGFLLAGSSFSGKTGDKSETSRGDRDYWIIKTDAHGKKQWDKTYGGSGSDELKKVIQLASGEYVLGGHSNSPTSVDKSQASQGGTDYWILKISSSGTVIWDKRFGGYADETLGSFTATREGGFLLGGTSLSGNTGDKSQMSRGEADYWIVKTDKNGLLVWDKTFGGSHSDKVYSVGRGQDNYFISGTSSSGKEGDKTQNSNGGQDFWLITLDTKGNKIWDKSFGGSQDDELRASTFTKAGHYILAGHSYSGRSGDKTQAGQGESDYWVVEIDPQGNKVQDQSFGGSGPEELRTVTPTKDGGLLLGGRSGSGISGNKTQPSQGGTDYWLVKVALKKNSPVVARTIPNSGPAMVFAKLPAFTAYPNPFQEHLTLSFTLPKTQMATVRVLDSQGREVATLFQGEVQANRVYQVEWSANNQQAGMYLLQLQTALEQNTQKILLQY